jgi:transcription elongation factor GreA
MSEITYLTKEGLEKLKQELHELKAVERPRISKAIAEAREKGDLSENAEYDAAKEAQGMLEMKIAQLQTLLSNARLIDASKVDTSKVTILSSVRVQNHSLKKEFTFMLVSEKEADLKAGKISVKSAIGSALMGKQVGDVVEVQVPAGLMKMEILEIFR